MEGRMEGRMEALRHLLVLKFGALSPAHEAQLAGASAAQVERGLERILSAVTVEDVFRA